METLVWVLGLYAGYFATIFVGGGVVLGLFWLVSRRSRSRTMPENSTGAQSSAPNGNGGA